VRVKRTKAKRAPAAKLDSSRMADGRYTYGDMARTCVCGHALGVHAAARVRTPDGVKQHCMAGDQDDGEHCDCECFKPARKRG
jgi:hypothetical protein